MHALERQQRSAVYLLTCNNACGPRSRCFLGKCFCLPGWAGVQCSQRQLATSVINPALCPAFETYDELTKADVQPYSDPAGECKLAGEMRDPLNCAVACFWQADAGIVQVSKQLWHKVSDHEFSIWKGVENWAPEDRDAEHAEGFGDFAAVPADLGNILEIGAGPYTQTKNMLRRRTDVRVNRIYLAEPNIFRYLTLANCAYREGRLEGHPVNLMSLPVEELPADEFFDTVLQINVVENVYNAFDFLTAVYRALRPGGTFIFHERYFNDAFFDDSRVLGTLALHPMRLTRNVMLHLFRLFEPLYINPLTTVESRKRNMNEHGYYFVGRKRDAPVPETEPDADTFASKFPI